VILLALYVSERKPKSDVECMVIGSRLKLCENTDTAEIFVGSGRKLKRKYEGISKSFRIGRLERELQMVQLSTTRCSCIASL
jgi:hypothetical protein